MKKHDTYADLPPKQQRMVDMKARSIVEGAEKPNTEIARELDTDRSYVSQVLNTQSHILDSRIDELRGGDALRTRGGTTAGPGAVDVAAALAAAEGKHFTAEVDLRAADITAILEGEAPERLQQQLLAALVDAALQDGDGR